jgi:hypothetical protein
MSVFGFDSVTHRKHFFKERVFALLVGLTMRLAFSSKLGFLVRKLIPKKRFEFLWDQLPS